MTIHIDLSTESIESAIAQLTDYKEEFEDNVELVVELLTNEGAEVAQAAYGNWGVSVVPLADGTSGEIIVAGDMPLIAEFGAGDTVINPGALFENSPSTDVYPGSYSLLEGSKEYATYGSWHFAGKKYTHVDPHLGLFSAKNYIIENSTEVAKEVFGA